MCATVAEYCRSNDRPKQQISTSLFYFCTLQALLSNTDQASQIRTDLVSHPIIYEFDLFFFSLHQPDKYQQSFREVSIERFAEAAWKFKTFRRMVIFVLFTCDNSTIEGAYRFCKTRNVYLPLPGRLLSLRNYHLVNSKNRKHFVALTKTPIFSYQFNGWKIVK